MIFATVGTQLPFDRLLGALDAWAYRNPDVPLVAQTGATDRHFAHMTATPHLGQSAFRAHIEAAQLVVAHAGMGSILSAVDLGKPIILMPRRAELGEHRNDHQRDTAEQMAKLSNVIVVEDAAKLHSALDLGVSRALTGNALSTLVAPEELDPLINVVRDFIWAGATSQALPGCAKK